MRYLIDAQLPPRLARFLTDRGHMVEHVAELPSGMTMADADIAEYADSSNAIVVTKDDDFRHAHAATGAPERLLLVMIDNTSNRELIDVFDRRFDDLVAAFRAADFVELHRDLIVVHDSPAG